MKMEEEALSLLREAESLIGTPTTEMFMDEVAPEHRRNWLKRIRKVLTANAIKPENLAGRWRTNG
jgi:hypothetical protein